MQVTLTGEPTEKQKPRHRREEWLREQYVEQRKSMYEIADMVDCSTSTVHRHLNKYDIQTRTRYKQISGKLRREEWLREQYVEKRKSMAEIADMIDCSHKTVPKYLNKHGIETRIPYKQISDKIKREEWLREQYVEKRKSITEIADMVDCGTSSVSKYLNKHGIETRSPYKQTPDKIKREKWLREQYVNQGKSTYEIADMVDCSSGTVSKYLNKHDIETRSPDVSGADNPNYAGGDPEYGPGWTESKKRAVRDRDGNACRNCGMSQEQHRRQYNRRLDVHHIKKAREFDDADKRNAMSNLVALCRNCHRSHFERIADTGLQPQIPGVNYPDD